MKQYLAESVEERIETSKEIRLEGTGELIGLQNRIKVRGAIIGVFHED